MTLFDGWPPFYAERRTSADVHERQVYLAFVISVLACIALLLVPGFRGFERCYFLVRVTSSLLVGSLIIACAFGLSWHVAHAEAEFPKSAYDDNLTTFALGLNVGLVQFNVTLRGGSPIKLNLNEQFFYDSIDDTIEDSLMLGMPFPIIHVTEYFSIKRTHTMWPWGKRYWMAGHYTSYMIWFAFASWVLTNLTFPMSYFHGSLFMTFTGLLLLAANIAFSTVNTAGRLKIMVGHNDPPQKLEVSFGWSFWVCLTVGLLCTIFGVAAFLIQKYNINYLHNIFMANQNDDASDTKVSHVTTISDDYNDMTTRGLEPVTVSQENEVKFALKKRKLTRTFTGDSIPFGIDEK